jgi:hypothetical protein
MATVRTGLLNGIVSNQKTQTIWVIWDGLEMGNLCIFFRHFEYIKGIGCLVSFWCISPFFGILCQEKSGNPVQEAADTL